MLYHFPKHIFDKKIAVHIALWSINKKKKSYRIINMSYQMDRKFNTYSPYRTNIHATFPTIKKCTI